jgi:hypothetical protein
MAGSRPSIKLETKLQAVQSSKRSENKIGNWLRKIRRAIVTTNV